MAACDNVRSKLIAAPGKWLLTGVEGFMGSNLLEELLKLDLWKCCFMPVFAQQSLELR